MTPTWKLLLSAVIASSVLAMPLAFGDASDSSAMSSNGSTVTPMAKPDAKDSKMFVLEDFRKWEALTGLHHLNQKEIKASQMALDKTQSQQVKDVANHIIADHTAADKKVMDLAKAQNVALPEFAANDCEKGTMERLDKLSGTEFDRAFQETMRMGHKRAAQDLRLVREDSTSLQVRSLIDGLLPTIREHAKTVASIKIPNQMAGQVSSESSDAVSMPADPSVSGTDAGSPILDSSSSPSGMTTTPSTATP